MLEYNPLDLRYAGLLFLTLILLLVVYIVNAGSLITPTWYSIYLILSIAFIFAVPVALATGNRVIAYDVYGQGVRSKKDFWVITAISVFSGLIFLIGPISGTGSIFNFQVLPTTIGSIATLSLVALLGNMFVIGFIDPHLEDTVIASILIPTLEKMESTGVGLGYMLAFIGFIVMFLLLNIAAYIGALIILIAIPFITIPDLKQITVRHAGIITELAIVFGSIIWAALHGYAFQGQQNFFSALLSVFTFGVLVFNLNMILKTKIASRIAHSVYNSFLFAYTFQVNYIIAFIVVVMFIYSLYGVFTGVGTMPRRML
jgi:hypothetical protein